MWHEFNDNVARELLLTLVKVYQFNHKSDD